MSVNLQNIMKTMSIFLGGACLALLMAAMASGCSSTKSAESTGDNRLTKLAAPVGPIDPALEALAPRFFATPRPDGTYYIGFSANAGGSPTSPNLVALRGIHSLSAEIYAPDNHRIDSLGTQAIIASGTMQGEGDQVSITGTGGVLWKPASTPPPGTVVLITIRGDHGMLGRLVTVVPDAWESAETDHSRILHMSIESRDIGAGNVEFTLRVDRIAPSPAGEYLPTAEKFRIEVRNDLNEIVWSTATGKIYAQSTGAVEPIETGKEVEYRAIWNGMSEFDHAPAPPGTYSIIATIPAKPTPYVLREELTRSAGF